MDRIDAELDGMLRAELGDEPSRESVEYARKLYEQYRLPDTTSEVPEDQ